MAMVSFYGICWLIYGIILTELRLFACLGGCGLQLWVISSRYTHHVSLFWVSFIHGIWCEHSISFRSERMLFINLHLGSPKGCLPPVSHTNCKILPTVLSSLILATRPAQPGWFVKIIQLAIRYFPPLAASFVPLCPKIYLSTLSSTLSDCFPPLLSRPMIFICMALSSRDFSNLFIDQKHAFPKCILLLTSSVVPLVLLIVPRYLKLLLESQIAAPKIPRLLFRFDFIYF